MGQSTNFNRNMFELSAECPIQNQIMESEPFQGPSLSSQDPSFDWNTEICVSNNFTQPQSKDTNEEYPIQNQIIEPEPFQGPNLSLQDTSFDWNTELCVSNNFTQPQLPSIKDTQDIEKDIKIVRKGSRFS